MHDRRRSFAVLWLAIVTAGSSAFAAKVPIELMAVEKAYTQAGSLQADFEQEEFSAAFNDKKNSTGRLTWKSPDRLRWETLTPDPGLVVSNGKTLWVYTPPFDPSENGQVLIRKASQVKGRLFDALLAARFSKAVRQGLIIEKIGTGKFELRLKGVLKKASLQLDPERPLISLLTLEYQDGNRSTITLKNATLGVETKADHFEFKIPTKTEVLRD